MGQVKPVHNIGSPASRRPVRLPEKDAWYENPLVVLAIFFGCLILHGAIEGGMFQ